MTFLYAAFIIIVLLLAILFVFSLKENSSKNGNFNLDSLYNEIQRIEFSVKAEIAFNRKESFEIAAQAKKELAASLFSFEKKLNHDIKLFYLMRHFLMVNYRKLMANDR